MSSKKGQAVHPKKVIWDKASYPTTQLVKDYLQQLNRQLPQTQWPLTLIGLATHAPEQNPIEDVWLQGKTQIRTQTRLKTFFQVKKHVTDTITANTSHFNKIKGYFPSFNSFSNAIAQQTTANWQSLVFSQW